ncbi:MAG: hypothetical protein Q3960_01615 [Lactobacillus sp.]|nr:hypothetical protein [Lactobacillus sp.]
MNKITKLALLSMSALVLLPNTVYAKKVNKVSGYAYVKGKKKVRLVSSKGKKTKHYLRIKRKYHFTAKKRFKKLGMSYKLAKHNWWVPMSKLRFVVAKKTSKVTKKATSGKTSTTSNAKSTSAVSNSSSNNTPSNTQSKTTNANLTSGYVNKNKAVHLYDDNGKATFYMAEPKVEYKFDKTANIPGIGKAYRLVSADKYITGSWVKASDISETDPFAGIDDIDDHVFTYVIDKSTGNLKKVVGDHRDYHFDNDHIEDTDLVNGLNVKTRTTYYFQNEKARDKAFNIGRDDNEVYYTDKQLEVIKANMWNLINQYRKDHGLTELKHNDELQKYADYITYVSTPNQGTLEWNSAVSAFCGGGGTPDVTQQAPKLTELYKTTTNDKIGVPSSYTGVFDQNTWQIVFPTNAKGVRGKDATDLNKVAQNYFNAIIERNNKVFLGKDNYKDDYAFAGLSLRIGQPGGNGLYSHLIFAFNMMSANNDQWNQVWTNAQ